tara:strand:- start:594 stop:917 length:324 start_codon:yes stop_codon:yes gene_type:complete
MAEHWDTPSKSRELSRPRRVKTTEQPIGGGFAAQVLSENQSEAVGTNEMSLQDCYRLIQDLSDDERQALEELVPQPEGIHIAERIFQMSTDAQDEVVDAINVGKKHV